MAEVDFGDSELFQQLDEERPVATHLRFETDEDAPEEIQELRERLEECEETISRLNAENEELRRKLKTVTRPSGVKVDNTRTDGPLLHVLYGNNNISKECRQEIEDSICSLIEKHQQQKNGSQQTTSYVPPQASSFFLEDEQRDKSSDALKKIKEAFSVVGSVLYFTSFCLDKLGQPLLNDNPQLTDGWEVPKYPQVFSGVMTLDGQELQIKEKRARPCCFNCGQEDHQLRDCPKPKDMARINEKRKEFSQGNNNVSSQRYHFEEVEERFTKYKPGVVSQDLLEALGVSANKVPPFIYRMRELGYPPGWLKEAEEENSGLQLYDGNASTEVTEEENGHGQKVSYDLSKLVDFPGFNVGLPAHVKDEYRAYGSVPMQYQHMKQNFAAFLSTNYPTPGSSSSKRRHESESTPRHSKKRRSNPDSSRCSDMDLDSASDEGMDAEMGIPSDVLIEYGSTYEEKYSDSTVFLWNTGSRGSNTDLRWSPYVELFTAFGHQNGLNQTDSVSKSVHLPGLYASYSVYKVEFASGNQRRHLNLTPQQSAPPDLKVQETAVDSTCNSDMDLDTDQGTPCQAWSPSASQLQPLVPPNPPSVRSPPPLPPGAPPVTSAPLKGTSPPGKHSPEDEMEESDVGLSLEELELEQLLLKAALERIESGSPESVPQSAPSPATLDDEVENLEEQLQTVIGGLENETPEPVSQVVTRPACFLESDGEELDQQRFAWATLEKMEKGS